MTKGQKLQKIFDEDMKDPKKKAKYEAIQDDLLHMIYVSPSLYRILFSLNLAIPGEELSKHKDIYYIFTKPYHHPTKEPLCFYTTKKNAMAIKQLLKNKPQLMFPGRNGIRYRKEQLIIDRVKIDLSGNEDRRILCDCLFGYGRAKKKDWTLTELDKKFQVSYFDDNNERYQFYRNRVRSLNEAIFEATGYRELVLINGNRVWRNPVYKSR